jgi:hypothetical protein
MRGSPVKGNWSFEEVLWVVGFVVSLSLKMYE